MSRRERYVSPFDLHTSDEPFSWCWLRWAVGATLIWWSINGPQPTPAATTTTTTTTTAPGPPTPAQHVSHATPLVPLSQMVFIYWVWEVAQVALFAVWQRIEGSGCLPLLTGCISAALDLDTADPCRSYDTRVHILWCVSCFFHITLRVWSYHFLPPAEVAAVHIASLYLTRPKLLLQCDILCLFALALAFISELIRRDEPHAGMHPYESKKSTRAFGVLLAVSSAFFLSFLRLRRFSPVYEEDIALGYITLGAHGLQDACDGEGRSLLGSSKRHIDEASGSVFYLRKKWHYAINIGLCLTLWWGSGQAWCFGGPASEAALGMAFLPPTPLVVSPLETIACYPLQWVALGYPFEPISVLGAFFMLVTFLFYKECEVPEKTQDFIDALQPDQPQVVLTAGREDDD